MQRESGDIFKILIEKILNCPGHGEFMKVTMEEIFVSLESLENYSGDPTTLQYFCVLYIEKLLDDYNADQIEAYLRPLLALFEKHIDHEMLHVLGEHLLSYLDSNLHDLKKQQLLLFYLKMLEIGQTAKGIESHSIFPLTEMTLFKFIDHVLFCKNMALQKLELQVFHALLPSPMNKNSIKPFFPDNLSLQTAMRRFVKVPFVSGVTAFMNCLNSQEDQVFTLDAVYVTIAGKQYGKNWETERTYIDFNCTQRTVTLRIVMQATGMQPISIHFTNDAIEAVFSAELKRQDGADILIVLKEFFAVLPLNHQRVKNIKFRFITQNLQEILVHKNDSFLNLFFGNLKVFQHTGHEFEPDLNSTVFKSISSAAPHMRSLTCRESSISSNNKTEGYSATRETVLSTSQLLPLISLSSESNLSYSGFMVPCASSPDIYEVKNLPDINELFHESEQLPELLEISPIDSEPTSKQNEPPRITVLSNIALPRGNLSPTNTKPVEDKVSQDLYSYVFKSDESIEQNSKIDMLSFSSLEVLSPDNEQESNKDPNEIYQVLTNLGTPHTLMSENTVGFETGSNVTYVADDSADVWQSPRMDNTNGNREMVADVVQNHQETENTFYSVNSYFDESKVDRSSAFVSNNDSEALELGSEVSTKHAHSFDKFSRIESESVGTIKNYQANEKVVQQSELTNISQSSPQKNGKQGTTEQSSTSNDGFQPEISGDRKRKLPSSHDDSINEFKKPTEQFQPVDREISDEFWSPRSKKSSIDMHKRLSDHLDVSVYTELNLMLSPLTIENDMMTEKEFGGSSVVTDDNGDKLAVAPRSVWFAPISQVPSPSKISTLMSKFLKFRRNEPIFSARDVNRSQDIEEKSRGIDDPKEKENVVSNSTTLGSVSVVSTNAVSHQESSVIPSERSIAADVEEVAPEEVVEDASSDVCDQELSVNSESTTRKSSRRKISREESIISAQDFYIRDSEDKQVASVTKESKLKDVCQISLQESEDVVIPQLAETAITPQESISLISESKKKLTKKLTGTKSKTGKDVDTADREEITPKDQVQDVAMDVCEEEVPGTGQELSAGSETNVQYELVSDPDSSSPPKRLTREPRLSRNRRDVPIITADEIDITQHLEEQRDKGVPDQIFHGPEVVAPPQHSENVLSSRSSGLLDSEAIRNVNLTKKVKRKKSKTRKGLNVLDKGEITPEDLAIDVCEEEVPGTSHELSAGSETNVPNKPVSDPDPSSPPKRTTRKSRLSRTRSDDPIITADEIIIRQDSNEPRAKEVADQIFHGLEVVAQSQQSGNLLSFQASGLLDSGATRNVNLTKKVKRKKSKTRKGFNVLDKGEITPEDLAIDVCEEEAPGTSHELSAGSETNVPNEPVSDPDPSSPPKRTTRKSRLSRTRRDDPIITADEIIIRQDSIDQRDKEVPDQIFHGPEAVAQSQQSENLLSSQSSGLLGFKATRNVNLTKKVKRNKLKTRKGFIVPDKEKTIPKDHVEDLAMDVCEEEVPGTGQELFAGLDTNIQHELVSDPDPSSPPKRITREARLSRTRRDDPIITADEINIRQDTEQQRKNEVPNQIFQGPEVVAQSQQSENLLSSQSSGLLDFKATRNVNLTKKVKRNKSKTRKGFNVPDKEGISPKYPVQGIAMDVCEEEVPDTCQEPIIAADEINIRQHSDEQREKKVPDQIFQGPAVVAQSQQSENILSSQSSGLLDFKAARNVNLTKTVKRNKSKTRKGFNVPDKEEITPKDPVEDIAMDVCEEEVAGKCQELSAGLETNVPYEPVSDPDPSSPPKRLTRKSRLSRNRRNSSITAKEEVLMILQLTESALTSQQSISLLSETKKKSTKKPKGKKSTTCKDVDTADKEAITSMDQVEDVVMNVCEKEVSRTSHEVSANSETNVGHELPKQVPMRSTRFKVDDPISSAEDINIGQDFEEQIEKEVSVIGLQESGGAEHSQHYEKHASLEAIVENDPVLEPDVETIRKTRLSKITVDELIDITKDKISQDFDEELSAELKQRKNKASDNILHETPAVVVPQLSESVLLSQEPVSLLSETTKKSTSSEGNDQHQSVSDQDASSAPKRTSRKPRPRKTSMDEPNITSKEKLTSDFEEEQVVSDIIQVSEFSVVPQPTENVSSQYSAKSMKSTEKTAVHVADIEEIATNEHDGDVAMIECEKEEVTRTGQELSGGADTNINQPHVSDQDESLSPKIPTRKSRLRKFRIDKPIITSKGKIGQNFEEDQTEMSYDVSEKEVTHAAQELSAVSETNVQPAAPSKAKKSSRKSTRSEPITVDEPILTAKVINMQPDSEQKLSSRTNNKEQPKQMENEVVMVSEQARNALSSQDSPDLFLADTQKMTPKERVEEIAMNVCEKELSRADQALSASVENNIEHASDLESPSFRTPKRKRKISLKPQNVIPAKKSQTQNIISVDTSKPTQNESPLLFSTEVLQTFDSLENHVGVPNTFEMENRVGSVVNPVEPAINSINPARKQAAIESMARIRKYLARYGLQRRTIDRSYFKKLPKNNQMEVLHSVANIDKKLTDKLMDPSIFMIRK